MFQFFDINFLGVVREVVSISEIIDDIITQVNVYFPGDDDKKQIYSKDYYQGEPKLEVGDDIESVSAELALA